MIVDLFLFLAGLLMLYAGAEFLVRGASQLALIARINPLIVGLTVVAFGTSSPEIIVSFIAALSDKADMAVGNIVGSNIANIALILGVSGIISPLSMRDKHIRREVTWMLGASVVFWIFTEDRMLVSWEGLSLFSALIIFIVVSIIIGYRSRMDKLATKEIQSEKLIEKLSKPVQIIISLIASIIGILILVWGSEITINSAVAIARAVGVSEIIIGLTMVAFGTSLPELATSIISLKKRQNAILIGNLIGSNIFNLLCVGGLVSAFVPLAIKERIYSFDLPVMLLVSLFLALVIFQWKKISRGIGFLFLILYLIYILYTFLYLG